MPLDILAQPLNHRGKKVQLEIQASDGHGLFMTLLRLDASIAMTPRAASRSCLNSNRVFEAQTLKPSAGGFEAQTIKPFWRSISAMSLLLS